MPVAPLAMDASQNWHLVKLGSAMSTTSAKVLALVCSLLSTSVTVVSMRASDPPRNKSARLDAIGDSLPEGAVARLGTLRLVHRGHVTAVAVSPGGKLLASGVQSSRMVTRLADVSDKQVARDNRVQTNSRGIRIWDTCTGKLLRELHTPEGEVSSLLFSPDGADLYGACGNHLGCWNPHTGEKRWQNNTPDKGTLHTYLPATNLVLAGNRIVSVHTGNLNCVIRGEKWTTSTSHTQRAVRIWNRKTGALESLPVALESTNTTGKDIPVLFHDAAVSADGRFAAVISSYGRPPWQENGPFNKGEEKDQERAWQYRNPRIRIVDLGGGTVRHDFPAASIENTRLAFSDDSSLLAITAGKELQLFDVVSGGKKQVAADVPAIQKLQFMRGTQQIAAQFADQSIRVWDCTTGRAIEPHAVRLDHFHASPHSPITAIGHGNSIQLFERESGKPLLDFDGHRETPSIRFGSGRENTLSSLDTERLYQWESGKWNVRRHIRMQAADVGWHYGRWSYVGGLHVSPEKGLLLRDDEKGLALHDLRTGKLIRTLESGAGKRWSSFFSQDSARVISMEEKQVISFDVQTGKRFAAIDHSSGDPFRLFGYGPSCWPVVSPLATFFAKSDKCLDVDLIQLDSGKHRRKLSVDTRAAPERRYAILQLWFSPDERFVLAEIHRQLGSSSSETTEIAIWDTEGGAIVQEIIIVPQMQVWHRSSLQIHSLQTLAMSPDRRLIALARRDHGDIEIWDTASGTRRGILTGHEGAVTDLAFSRDGRYLASASDDTTVLVWDLNRPLHAADFSDELAEADVAASWRTLAEPDAARADTVIWRLVKAKAQSTAFLKLHLRPQLPPNPNRVKQLLDDLDSPDFKTRSLAHVELEQFHSLVLSELKAAIAMTGSLERQRRVQRLLAQAERAALPFGTSDQVREWRALEVLERIGSPEAVELLQTLAAGTPNSSLTTHAAEVLARLGRP